MKLLSFLLVTFFPLSLFCQSEFIVRVNDKGIETPLAELNGRSVLDPSLLKRHSFDGTNSRGFIDALQELSRWYVIRAMSLEQVLAIPGVEEAWHNRKIRIHQEMSNDPLVKEQWALRIVAANRAWQHATGKGIKVGIVDTGIDWEHPDLVNALWINPQEDLNGNGRFDAWPHTEQRDGIFGDLNGIDDDGNGWTDDVIGYDVVDQFVPNLGDWRDPDPMPFDEHGHGTSVGSVVAAATNNHLGMAGVAYDSKLVSLRAFDVTGNAEEDDIAAAIIYCALTGVDVINMSFGDAFESPIVKAALDLAAAANCVLVASSGNSGTVSNQYPASYPNVIAVGATDSKDQRAAFSSYGSTVDITAPGVGIMVAEAGGGFRLVNGTSFAAPHVAAAAAMLRELNPYLDGAAVRSILNETSRDLGDTGFDIYYGNGRLQIDAALTVAGQGRVLISIPAQDAEFNLDKEPNIHVTGSAISTLFDRYEVLMGSGMEPVTWISYANGTQMIDSLLAEIDIRGLTPGTYTLALRVHQVNGRTVEDRIRIHLVQGAIQASALGIVSAWLDDRKVGVLSWQTDRRTSLLVEVRSTTDPTDVHVFDNSMARTRKHSILLPNLDYGKKYAVTAMGVSAGNDTVYSYGWLTVDTNAAPTTRWSDVRTEPLPGYYLNNIVGLYDPATPSFLMNFMVEGAFGPLVVVSYINGQFRVTDTLLRVLIPRGIGDSNGDGIPDVLTHSVGSSILFQAKMPGGSPFATILFADTTSRNLNAAGMYDLTGDGKEELLSVSNKGLSAHTFIGGTYSVVGEIQNPTPPAAGSQQNRYDEIRVATGDFTGDGSPKVAFGDTDGDLIIVRYQNNRFQVDTTFLHDGIGGSGYVMDVDVNGDGIVEIFHAVPDSIEPDPNGEYGRQVWTCRLYGYLPGVGYSLLWMDRFAGVRYGIGYRNGIDKGQLDNLPGEEIVLCLYPRLYVFRWSENTKTLIPLLYRDNVTSSRMLTYDFNGNGIQELGFGSTTTGTGFIQELKFIEFDTTARVGAPLGVRGRVTDSSTIVLHWNVVPGATRYVAYVSATPLGIPWRSDTVAGNTIEYTMLSRSTTHYFRVVTLVESDSIVLASIRSNPVAVYLGNPVSVKSVRQMPMVVAQQHVHLIVAYSGHLSAKAPTRSSFRLIGHGKDILASSVTVTGDSALTVSFVFLGLSEGTYSLFCDSFKDRFGVLTRDTMLAIELNVAKPYDEMFVKSLRVINPLQVSLLFSEAVDAGATNVSNYVIRPVGTIASIEQTATDEVIISFANDGKIGARGMAYIITVSGVVATSGRAITSGAGNTIGFVLVASNESDIYVYPQPASLKIDQLVYFANLPPDTGVEILNSALRSIRRIESVENLGGVSWDMHDDKGSRVPQGIYYFRTMSNGLTGTINGKFLLHR